MMVVAKRAVELDQAGHYAHVRRVIHVSPECRSSIRSLELFLTISHDLHTLSLPLALSALGLSASGGTALCSVCSRVEGL